MPCGFAGEVETPQFGRRSAREVSHSLGARSSRDISGVNLGFPSGLTPARGARARPAIGPNSRTRSPRWLCAARTVTTSEQASLALGLVLSPLVLSRCSCVNS
eukprot:scaffold15981_cov69-Phaeocystis_antarctica.AAC.2